MNYTNPLNKDYFMTGDCVREDDPNDRFFEVTQEVKLGKMLAYPGVIVRYNGKSAVIRPDKDNAQFDEETNHPSIEIAIRRGWLKPWVKPEDRPLNKALTWLKGFGSKLKNDKATKQEKFLRK